MEEKKLFHTEIVNEDGGTGKAFVKSNGLTVSVSSPLSQEPGTNPEELFGLAFSTCLNATVQAILKEKEYTNKSIVEIDVDLISDIEGYHFDVQAFVWIKDLPMEKSKEIVAAAEVRCPVSKLVASSKTVTVKAVSNLLNKE